MYGSSSFDRWLEDRADSHYDCDGDDKQEYMVSEVNPNDPTQYNHYSVMAEDIDDAWQNMSISWNYIPKLKNGKRSKAKETFFSPNENMGWVKIGKKTIATIRLEE